MTQKKPESVPKAMAIRDAMSRSSPLATLRERLADADRRFAAIRPLLPAFLLQHVHPGPVDESGWTLLVDNSAVAAKLRNLQPRIERTLLDAGWQVSATRIHIQPPQRSQA